jgi:hypothetical protein
MSGVMGRLGLYGISITGKDSGPDRANCYIPHDVTGGGVELSLHTPPHGSVVALDGMVVGVQNQPEGQGVSSLTVQGIV